MTKARFTINFLGQRTVHEPDIEHLKRYFLEYSPEKWVSEPSGGAFKYIDEDGVNYNCLIVHSQHHGICVMLDKWNKQFVSGKSTVGDASRMQEVVDVGSDEIYPVGCFVSPDLAWPIVEQYLNEPTKYPSSELLKDTTEIDWPEIY